MALLQMKLILYLLSLQISETTGAIAEPAFPAKLLINTIVEYCEIFDLISSETLYMLNL